MDQFLNFLELPFFNVSYILYFNCVVCEQRIFKGRSTVLGIRSVIHDRMHQISLFSR